MRVCHHDGEIGFGLFAVSQRYAIDAVPASGGVSPPMTLQYQLSAASPSEGAVFVCRHPSSDHKKDVVGYATEFPASVYPMSTGCGRPIGAHLLTV